MREDMPLDDFFDTLLADDSLTKASSSPASIEEKDTSPLETLFLNALNSYPELVEPVLPESKELNGTIGLAEKMNVDVEYDEIIHAPDMEQQEDLLIPLPKLSTEEESLTGECDQVLIKEPSLADVSTQTYELENNFSYLHERVAKSFQSIVCVINDTQIAFPLAELGGIHQISRIDRIAGKAEWCLGVMDIKGTSYNIVDGTRWLIDPKGNASDADGERTYQYVILLNDSDWGIACHDLVDTVLCEKENIKWRDPSRSKPWLAGIMKEQMCILLDTFAVVDMLQQGLVSNQQ